MLAVLLDLQVMISWITGIVNRTLVDQMVVLILTMKITRVYQSVWLSLLQ